MEELCRYLRRNGDFTVLNVGYASTRKSISDHARALSSVIRHLDGVQQISLVGHSLGNLVFRRYLAQRETALTAGDPHPAIHRIVMLGPPNNGAELAERLRGNQIAQVIWGASGNQIAREWKTLEKQLAIPSCEFGIIAGGTHGEGGYNPLIPGDDDLVVSVSETRLPGAHDFLVVPVVHTVIMDHAGVQESTLRFLQFGHFLSPEQRCPIPRVSDDDGR
jgi:pimeloyl-ACP methyl ester carboxylesterase